MIRNVCTSIMSQGRRQKGCEWLQRSCALWLPPLPPPHRCTVAQRGRWRAIPPPTLDAKKVGASVRDHFGASRQTHSAK